MGYQNKYNKEIKILKTQDVKQLQMMRKEA